MNKITKQNWLISLSVIALFAGIYGYIYFTADPPGYCRAQQRYIADEEFIKASVALLEWDMNRTYQSGRKKKDVLNFYKIINYDWKNPNCCSVERGQPTIFERKFGWQEIYMRLIPREGESPHRYGDDLYHLNFNVCGKLRDSAPGFGSTHRQEITTTNYLEVIKTQ